MANALVIKPLSTEAAWVITDPIPNGSNPGNLRTMQPGQVWGYGGATPAALIDTGSAQAVNLVALISHNGVAGGTVRLRAGATSGVGDYDSGSLTLFPTGFEAIEGFSRHIWFIRFAPAKSHRWWRVDVSNNGQPFVAGRLYLANVTEPARNYRWGAAFGVIDPTNVQEALGGQLWPGVEAGRRRSLNFAMPWQSEAEFTRALALQMTRGRSKDVLVIMNADATVNGQAGLLYGLQVDLPPLVGARLRIFETAFRVEELTP